MPPRAGCISCEWHLHPSCPRLVTSLRASDMGTSTRRAERGGHKRRSLLNAQGTDEAEARRGKFFADMAARMRQDLQS